ncbi:CHAD domain protein [compost metagenome]
MFAYLKKLFIPLFVLLRNTVIGMKRKRIKRFIEKRMKRIEKYAILIMYSGDKEVIHQLRIQFKKLRAFVRLVRLESSAKKKLKVPSKLKKIYQYSGSVRDLQIYYDHIIPFYKKKDGYTYQVLRQIAEAKSILLIALKQFRFHRILKHMTKRAPDRLSKKRIDRFIHQKSGAIDRLIGTKVQDTQLHALKKHLKDVSYSLKIFHIPLQNYFPIAGKANIAELNQFSDILNDYLDCVVGINLLSTALAGKLSARDRGVMKGIKKSWRSKKAKGLVLVKDNLLPTSLRDIGTGVKKKRK